LLQTWERDCSIKKRGYLLLDLRAHLCRLLQQTQKVPSKRKNQELSFLFIHGEDPISAQPLPPKSSFSQIPALPISFAYSTLGIGYVGDAKVVMDQDPASRK
jgi:hypothetical protein